MSGQSSNNSLRLTDTFMKAVLDDGWWELVNRTDGKTRQKVKAREIWERIATAAWLCADPGLQFHTTINDWHTCPQDGEIRASNPCSEYMFLDDTACNLASLNLMTFYDAEKGEIRIDDLRHAIRLWTIVLEISVLMAQFPAREIARKSYDFRTLGLGYANLGTLLMVMGIPYDSAEGRAIAAALSAILSAEAYATSAEMAAELGPFPRFTANRERHAPRHPQPRPGRLRRGPRGVRGPLGHPAAHRRPVLPAGPDGRGAPVVGPGARPRGEVRLPQRAGHRHRPHGHHRPRHGLRHHGRGAGLQPREVQEARRRRLLQDHQPLLPPALRRLGLHGGADRGHRALLPGPRHPGRRPGRLLGGAAARRASPTEPSRR